MTKSNYIIIFRRALVRVQPTKLVIRLFYLYFGGGVLHFAVVCGGLPAFHLFTAYRPKFWCWSVGVCGGLWWFAVVCDGLSYSHTLYERNSCKSRGQCAFIIKMFMKMNKDSP